MKNPSTFRIVHVPKQMLRITLLAMFLAAALTFGLGVHAPHAYAASNGQFVIAFTNAAAIKVSGPNQNGQNVTTPCLSANGSGSIATTFLYTGGVDWYWIGDVTVNYYYTTNCSVWTGGSDVFWVPQQQYTTSPNCPVWETSDYECVTRNF